MATSQGPGASNHDSEQATPTQEAPAESAFQPVTLAQSLHHLKEISTSAIRHHPTKLPTEG